MKRGFARYIILTVAIVALVGSVLDVGAQSKRKRRSRHSTKTAAPKPVIKNPTIAPPTVTPPADDVKVISTADQTDTDQSSDTPKPQSQRAKTNQSDSADMQQTINALSDQVNRLNDRLGQMQENDRYLADMERLTRAEQRAEGLRTQLIDVQTKIADLQTRLEQVEYNLKPDNIDRATQGYGSLHPEEARDARRKQLERERANIQAQLAILEPSKNRLESAIQMADSEVDILRQRLNQTRDAQNSDQKPESKPTNPRKP